MKPAVEVVELKSQATLLAGSGPGTSTDPITGGWADSRELDDFDFLLNGDDPLKMLLP